MYYKDLFLYGFYGSYIFIITLAMIIDFFIHNYFDAIVDLISVCIAIGAFVYYLRTKNREWASMVLFWIASSVIFLFVLSSHFDISIIFTLLIPMVAFILLSRKMILIHVGIYFVILGVIFAYGYSVYDTHDLLYSPKNISTYIIALLFVISFGIFYNIAIEQSYQELEYANSQKTFLLKEIHHRVKNNLNLISSILGIQKLESKSVEVHTLIEQNQLRLESIAMAHEMLYVQEDLENINFNAYVTKLTQHILKTDSKEEDIKLTIEMIPYKIPIDSMIQFGIIINELMVNSLKYAFDKNKGNIIITLKHKEGMCLFTYRDNGKGIDTSKMKKGFGLNLIEMAIVQLDAHMEILNDKGLVYEIRFKGINHENSHS